MTHDQYRRALAALSLTQQGAAQFLDVSLRTAHGWANGLYPVPESVAKLLQLMIKLGLKPEDV